MAATHTRYSANKYNARKTVVEGIKFDSKREAARYQQLRLLERAGQISGLRLKVKYPLVVNGVRIGRYTSDFNYVEDGREVVEDVKGHVTRDYRLRKLLMLALYGVEIRET
jgi:hypothetical protein